MNEELYLILHKVRGEPAFDIANKVSCSHCDGTDDSVCQCNWHRMGKIGPCGMCKGEGLFWIIPTSGHRAYPVQHIRLDELALPELAQVPSDLPDHYGTEREDDTNLASIARDILLRKGTIKAAKPIHRRF